GAPGPPPAQCFRSDLKTPRAVATSRPRHKMFGRMDVDPRRMLMRDDQIALGGLGGPTPLLACVGLTGTMNLFARTRHDLSSSNWTDRGVTRKAASAGGRTENRLPNGDRPHSSEHPLPSGRGVGAEDEKHGVATNEVDATSRDHAKLRVEKHHCLVGHCNPRPRWDMIGLPPGGEISGPSTG